MVDADPLGDLTRAESIEALREAVLTLPVRYREAVVLCDLQEMTYADAAAAIGCAVGTVRSRLHRGRALLAVKLAASARTVAGDSGRQSPRSPRGRLEHQPDAEEREEPRMKCHSLRDAIVELARGRDAGPGTRAAVESHVEHCAACAALMARERQLSQGLRALAAATSADECPRTRWTAAAGGVCRAAADAWRRAQP